MMFDKIAAGQWSLAEPDKQVSAQQIRIAVELLKQLTHRFYISKTAHQLASSFVSDKKDSNKICPEALIKLHPLVRLPFPTATWLETPAKDPDSIKYGLLLLEGVAHAEEGDELADKDISVIAFLEYQGQIKAMPAFCFFPSKLACGIGDDGEPCVILNFEVFEDGLKNNSTYQYQVGNAIYQCFVNLALINSPSLTIAKNVRIEQAVNNKRTAKGKMPLHDYHILEIKKEIIQNMGAAGTTFEGRRLHWKRGHFKVRKTGIFWWNPHLAGRKELGFVEKDYSVAG